MKRTDRLHHPLRSLAASAAVVGSAAALLAGVLAVPAGAVSGAPYAVKVLVTSNGLNLPTGAPATFTAKVSSVGHGVPGGQVAFSITGADSSTVSCDGGSPVALASGAATCSVGAGLLAASGPYTVVATYTDTLDSTYQGGTGTKTQNVVLGATTTTVTPSASPAVTGQPLSFTAAVAPSSPAAGAPSGTVTFGGVTCDGGSNVIAVSGGLAQCTVSAGLVSQTATYAVTGAYSGDTEFAASSGTAHQSVKPAATTVSLAPSIGTCTGDICSSGQGQSITFTATATTTAPGTGVPAGTFTFAITKPGSNVSFACDGGTNIVPLSGGTASCTISAGLPAIIYYKVSATLTATGYLSSVGSLFEFVPGRDHAGDVGAEEHPDRPDVRRDRSGHAGERLHGVEPAGRVRQHPGLRLQLERQQRLPGRGRPGGAGGVATLTIGGGEYIGTYSYQAVYTGDSNFYGSTAKSKYIYVGKATTSLSLTEPGGNYSTDGALVAITASVVADNGGAGSTLIGPPTGNVTFTVTDPNGNAVSCEGGNTIALPINPGQTEGSVTCVLPPGTLTDLTPPDTLYTVQVNYAGDSDYVASNARMVQNVVPAAV